MESRISGLVCGSQQFDGGYTSRSQYAVGTWFVSRYFGRCVRRGRGYDLDPDPDFKEDIVFNSEHPNWILHKELLKACKKKAAGHYYVGMPDLMEGLDVLAALKGTDKVLLDTVMQPEVLEHQMQQINDIYFKVFDELYDIIREGDEILIVGTG